MIIDWLQRISAIFEKDNVFPDRTISGPTVERRVVLTAPAMLAAGFVLQRTMPGDTANLSFEEFTKQATDYSAKLTAGADVDQEEYLFTIASLAVRVKKVPPPDFGEPFRSVIWSALSYRAQHMAFVQWRMNPNTVYQAHNHPNYNGMTLGLSGECRMRNF